MNATSQFDQTMLILSAAVKNTQQNRPPKASAQDPQQEFRSMIERRQKELSTSQSEQELSTQATQPQEDAPLVSQMELAAAMLAQPLVLLPDEAQNAQATMIPQQVMAAPPQSEVKMPQTVAQQPQLAGQSQEGQLAPSDTVVQSQVEQKPSTVQPFNQGQAEQSIQTDQPKVEVKVEVGSDDQQQQQQVPMEAGRPVFQNVERAPIKVADAPVLDTTSQDMNAQLADQVSKALEKGEYRLELKLAPRQLGEIVVELTRTGNGTLQVVLSASNERAANLLRDHATGLGTLLQTNTQVPVQVEVQRQQDAQQNQNHNWQQQGDGQHQHQQQQQQRHRQNDAEDFIQQLRLGLVSLSG